MTIKELLSKLLINTQNDSIEWQLLSSGGYRYVSDSGAVSIVRLSGGYYEIKLFDMDACFATYRTYEVIELHKEADVLYQAIVSSLNRAIERKIGDIFSRI